MINDLQEKVATYKRGYIQVDLDAIVANMRHMKEHIAECTKMIGVIKTDGYGHGSVPIAHCLEKLDFMYGFAVATAEEAHVLREAGVQKPLLILGYTFPYSYEMLAKEDIRPTVFRYDTIPELAAVAKKLGKKIKVHIKVDIGMSRIGITPDEEGLRFVEAVMSQEGLEIEGIFTHFSKADMADRTDTEQQLATFKGFLQMIEEQLKLQIPVKHCSNSAAILEYPDANMDAVRAGITLYGLNPSDEVTGEALDLRPALSFFSHIVYLKTIQKGQSVSYGGTFTADKEMRIATVPVGYGDGYPRSLSNKGYVLIRGQKAPILGRVCMDQFMVDVSAIADVAEGDLVTLIGHDGEECISAELLGEMSGRFNYELVCDLSQRIPRVYMRDGVPVGIQEGCHI